MWNRNVVAPNIVKKTSASPIFGTLLVSYLSTSGNRFRTVPLSLQEVSARTPKEQIQFGFCDQFSVTSTQLFYEGEYVLERFQSDPERSAEDWSRTVKGIKKLFYMARDRGQYISQYAGGPQILPCRFQRRSSRYLSTIFPS